MSRWTFTAVVALIALSVITALVFTQINLQAQEHSRQMVTVTPDDLKWMDGPASLPKGAQLAYVSGDMTKKEAFVVRIKLPANYTIPPHWHPANENVTVISGMFYMGEGPEINRDKLRQMPVVALR